MRKAVLRVTCYPWLTYAPVHVADELALFRKHDVQVELHEHSVGWIELLRLLSDGESDIILGNMWLALRRGGSGMVAVAACAQRCRFILVGRSEGRSGNGIFAWTDVKGASVAIASNIPTPWFAFREALTRSGIRLDEVNAVAGYAPSEALADVLAGEVDFAVVDLDSAQAQGITEVAALADSLDPIPWSSFFATRATVAGRSAEIKGFRRAVGEALAWLREQPAAVSAELLAARYHHFDGTQVQRSIQRYKDLDIWPEGAAVSRRETSDWRSVLERLGVAADDADLDQILALEA